MTAENTGYFHKESMEDLIGQRNSLLELRDNLQKQLSTLQAEIARLKEALRFAIDELDEELQHDPEDCKKNAKFKGYECPICKIEQALAGGGK